MFGVIGDIEESVAYQEIKQEGLDEGRKEGREIGIEEGHASMLFAQMTEKFGALPEPVVQKLKAGKNGELLRWGRNFVKALTIEDVFR